MTIFGDDQDQPEVRPVQIKKPEIPEYLMKPLRERLGLDENDKSRDSEISSRLPIDNLRELSAWEFGDPSWADWFVQRMQALGVKTTKELMTIY